MSRAASAPFVCHADHCAEVSGLNEAGGAVVLIRHFEELADRLNDAEYAFNIGHPVAETVERADSDANLVRAIQAYKFFYPTVSGAAT